MIITQEFFANFFIWVSNVVFFLSWIPQIFLNEKLQSTSGLSDLFLLGNLNSVISNLCYTFCSNLPLVYKVMNPLYAIGVFVIILQRFYYFDFRKNRKILWLFYANFFLILLIFIITIFYNSNLGWFLGWVPIVISLLKKVPQILKIYVTKSVHGLSFGFILLSLCAYIFEISGVLILGLPLQVLLQDVKGVFIYVVFLVQFLSYKGNSKIVDVKVC